MADLVERLSHCEDGALGTELIALLPDLAASEDPKNALQDVAAFVAAEDARWCSGAQKLVSYLNECDSNRDLVLELLDALLQLALQEPTQLSQSRQEALVEFFEVATTEISNGSGSKKWLTWGEQVLALAFQHGEHAEMATIVGGVATLLLQLRTSLLEKKATTPDLKLETFIWKNLAKLATACGPILAGIETGKEGDKQSFGRFSTDEATAAVVSCVELSVDQLQLLATETPHDPVDGAVLKFFRLYWRAFQRLLVAFADVLTCELENSVIALVNATANLIYVSDRSGEPGKELRSMVDQSITLVTSLHQQIRSDQARALLCTLLWHPASDMVRAVKQRQSSHEIVANFEAAIRWSHLLLLTAYVGSEPNAALEADRMDELNDDATKAVEISQLFGHFRECVLNKSSSDVDDLIDLFTDLMLKAFVHFDSITEVQLTLLKHTLYPDWMQRSICWEIWRELLCFCWDETVSAQALQMLLEVTQWEDDDSGEAFVLTREVGDGILDLIAFVYADLPTALKDVCLDQVTAVIDVISNEGPGHHFSLQVAAQLKLLEKLAGVQFLKYYDGPAKDEWVDKYLPMCFECCGTVLELLASEVSNPTSKQENTFGMIRVLDMCLLVLRGVYDHKEPRSDDNAELSVILVQMSTEALSQLARMSGYLQSIDRSNQQPGQTRNKVVKLEQSDTHCVQRAIETSLYLLAKLGPVLKYNTNNQCVQVMKDLVAIVDAAHKPQCRIETLVIAAQFLKGTLFDIQVAGGDMEVVWQLVLGLFQRLFAATRVMNRQSTRLLLLLSLCFDALYELLASSNILEMPGAPLKELLSGEMKQLFRQSLSMHRLTPGEAASALRTAQNSTLQCLQRNQGSKYRSFREKFPEEPADLYRETKEADHDTTMTSNKRPADGTETLPQKRHKLTHFVSLCREIESSISSLGDGDATAQLLSGKELEEATAVLHQLLAKTIALG